METFGQAALGGPWSLVRSDGVPMTSGDLEVRGGRTWPAARGLPRVQAHRRRRPQGAYHLLYFGFTHCPDICPNELVKMGRAVDLLGTCARECGARRRTFTLYAARPPAADKRGGLPPVVPVFVSLDPRRDGCRQVGAYVADFHPRMVGASGRAVEGGRLEERETTRGFAPVRTAAPSHTATRASRLRVQG